MTDTTECPSRAHHLPHLALLSSRTASNAADGPQENRCDATAPTGLPSCVNICNSSADQTDGLSKNENIDCDSTHQHKTAVRAAPATKPPALTFGLPISGRSTSPHRRDVNDQRGSKTAGNSPNSDGNIVNFIYVDDANGSPTHVNSTHRQQQQQQQQQQVSASRSSTPPSNLHLFAATVPGSTPPRHHSHPHPHPHPPVHPPEVTTAHAVHRSPMHGLGEQEGRTTAAEHRCPHLPAPLHAFSARRVHAADPLVSVASGERSPVLLSASTNNTATSTSDVEAPLALPKAPLRCLSARESMFMYKAFFDFVNAGYTAAPPAVTATKSSAMNSTTATGDNSCSGSGKDDSDVLVGGTTMTNRAGSSPMESFYTSTQRSAPRHFHSSLVVAAQNNANAGATEEMFTKPFTPLTVDFMHHNGEEEDDEDEIWCQPTKK